MIFLRIWEGEGLENKEFCRFVCLVRNARIAINNF